MSAETLVLPAEEPGAVERAARLLAAGQVVAIPTETVYGLAANAFDDAAVEKIFAAKGRPQDNPLIVHIAHAAALREVAGQVPRQALALAQAFWPGPLTLVLPRGTRVAPRVSAGLPTVAVRMPAHSVARRVIRAAGVPLAAPSANRSGRPSPTTARHVLQDMAGRIPLVLDGGPAAVGLESTVVSLVGPPVVLRPGFVTQRQLQEVLKGPVALAESLEKPLDAGEKPASPGMKHRHYAPRARLVLVEGSLPAFIAFAGKKAGPGVGYLCFAGEEALLPGPAVPYGAAQDVEGQAAGLFAALRRLDETGLEEVYARCPAKQGVGLAVYNRLLRAANFEVVVLPEKET